eukprot:9313214-Ditylum_brightwellii.AAC.1
MARVKVAWISRKDCNPDDLRKGKEGMFCCRRTRSRGASSHGIIKCGHKGQHQACIPHSWEYSEDQGKVLVIVRALYRLRSAGASWMAALAELLFSLGYKSTKTDPDVWICPAGTEFGIDYYEKFCIYVDNIVV